MYSEFLLKFLVSNGGNGKHIVSAVDSQKDKGTLIVGLCEFLELTIFLDKDVAKWNWPFGRIADFA